MSLYDKCIARVKDKDTYVRCFLKRLYCMTGSMFEYSGLPEEISSSQLEYALQSTGDVGFYKDNGKYYALHGCPQDLDVYGNPLNYRITATSTDYTVDMLFNIGDDIVLIGNDSMRMGIAPILERYAALMCDTDISLNTISVLSRVTMVLTAPDDRTRAAADRFVDKILQGEFSVIGENQFFDGVKLQTPTAGSVQRITDLIELVQYYKASMYNELGLQANWNSKRETLTDGEVGMNEEILLPLVDNMFAEREQAVARINDMFGLDISVSLASAWKIVENDANQEPEQEPEEQDSEPHDSGAGEPEQEPEPEPEPEESQEQEIEEHDTTDNESDESDESDDTDETEDTH